MSLDTLFEALRGACSERAWSAGVVLAREGRARLLATEADELRLLVESPQRPAPLTVWLWPADDDWACACESKACAHAAAAVITARQGPRAPAAPASPRLRYHLRRTPRGLRVDREVVAPDGTASPFEGRVARAPQLRPTSEDREAEQVLDVARERIPAPGWTRLLRLWSAGGAEVWFEGRALPVSAAPLPPVLVVEDEGRHFKLSLRRAREVEEVLGEGLVIAEGALRRMGDGQLDDGQRQALVRGVRYEPSELGTLVGEVLPRLARGLTLRVKTTRLPETRVVAPSLRLSVEPVPEGLLTRLDLVYGDPPLGRVEGDQLVTTGKVVPLRDPVAEQALRSHAERELRLGLARPTVMSEDEALTLVNERLAAFKGAVSGDLARWRLRREPARLRLSEDGRRLEGDASPAAVLEAWRAGRRNVPLLDGGMAPLPMALLERHGHVLADLLAAASPDGHLPRHATPAAAELARALDQPPPADLSALRPLVEGFEALPHAPPPPGLRASLRPYQQAGVDWVRFLWSVDLGGILADDMGLGKTLQALCALAGVEGPHLVVAPTSVLGNWAAEAARFLPHLRVHVHHGARRALDPDADLVITSYTLMRSDEAIASRAWSAVVLDESQAIKNPESQTARAAFALQARHRLTLTGTPVENRLDELWSQLHFLMPGFLGGRSSFRDRYGRPVADGDARATEALRRRVGPFVLRRRKQEVAADLPPRTDLVLRCELPEAQREIYEAVRQAAREEVARLAGGRTLEILELLLRLRQAACHPGLLPGRGPEAPSGKLDELLLHLDEVAQEGHRALVFSQWTSFLDLIARGLDGLGLGWCRLDGSTRDRDAVVRRFQAADGPPVFLISLKAGGTGLNLTAADYVFHMDPWWNPAVEEQATDRAHRIGQDKPVFSVRLIAADTVEERVLALQDQKRALADAALGGAAGLEGLGRAELLALFD